MEFFKNHHVSYIFTVFLLLSPKNIWSKVTEKVIFKRNTDSNKSVASQGQYKGGIEKTSIEI